MDTKQKKSTTRRKFTTTLSEQTVDKLNKMAPYLKRNGKCNDAIELLVDKAWEGFSSEMEKKNRDNRRTDQSIFHPTKD